VTLQKLNFFGSSKRTYTLTPAPSWRYLNADGWFVLSLAMVGWLLLALLILSLANASFAKHLLDPCVYWASRLFYQ
jgi:hypothetical protein